MEIETVISASLTVLSIGLLTISLISYFKYRNSKLLFVSLVFLFFLLKGIILTINIFIVELSNLLNIFGVFDVLILVILFASTFKRMNKI